MLLNRFLISFESEYELEWYIDDNKIDVFVSQKVIEK